MTSGWRFTVGACLVAGVAWAQAPGHPQGEWGRPPPHFEEHDQRWHDDHVEHRQWHGNGWQRERYDDRYRVGGHEYRERHFERPRVDVGRYEFHYRRLPHYHAWRSFGLAPPLARYPSLVFLQNGLLVGSYYEDGRTIYIYIVDEGGIHREFRVDQSGNILSETVLP